MQHGQPGLAIAADASVSCTHIFTHVLPHVCTRVYAHVCTHVYLLPWQALLMQAFQMLQNLQVKGHSHPSTPPHLCMSACLPPASSFGRLIRRRDKSLGFSVFFLWANDDSGVRLSAFQTSAFDPMCFYTLLVWTGSGWEKLFGYVHRCIRCCARIYLVARMMRWSYSSLRLFRGYWPMTGSNTPE